MSFSFEDMEWNRLSAFRQGLEAPKQRAKDARLWNPIGPQCTPGRPAMV